MLITYLFSLLFGSVYSENIYKGGGHPDVRYHPNVNFQIIPKNVTSCMKTSLAKQTCQDIEIISNVTDKFGEIKYANLSYSFNHGVSNHIQRMDLLWGDHKKGEYISKIPHPENKTQETMVNFTLNFADDLGYKDTEIGNYNYSNSKSSDHTGPVIKGKPIDKLSPQKPTQIKAIVEDNDSGVKNATLTYVYHNKNQTVQMVRVVQRQDQDIWYGTIWTAEVTKDFDANSTVIYYIKACDYANNCSKPIKYQYQTENVNGSEVVVGTKIVNSDPLKLTANIQTSIQHHLSRSKLKTGTLAQGIIIYNDDNSKTFLISLDPNNSNESMKNPMITARLFGDVQSFPFDSYNVSIILAIPVSGIKISGPAANLTPVSEASWDIRPTPIRQLNDVSSVSSLCTGSVRKELQDKQGQPPIVCPDYQGGSTFARTDIVFKRNYSIQGIVVPIYAIFFLLGSIFIFESKPDIISDRLALAISVFALIFTLPEIIKTQKPTDTFGPTIADSLVGIIIIATVSFTVGSVILSRLATRKKLQPWIDKIMFLFVLSIIVSYLFIFYKYPYKITMWLVPLLLFALGYGIVLQYLKTSRILTKPMRRMVLYVLGFTRKTMKK